MKKIRILGCHTNFKEKRDGSFIYSGVDLARLVLPLKYLDKDRFEVEFEFDLLRQYKTVEELTKHYDILFFSYIHNPMLYISLRVCSLKSKTKLVVDLDDNIWDVDPSHPFYKGDYAPGSENLFNRTAILLDSDYVTTTNVYLKNKILEHVGRSRDSITIFHNFIDLTMYDHKNIKPKEETNEIVIGWMGGSSHAKDINKLEFIEALKQIMFKYPNVRFKTTGYYPELKALFGFKYQYTLCRSDVNRFISEVWTEMGVCDIFVAPLSDSPYSKSKSYIKLLEYGATKRPVVAEEIDPYIEFSGLRPKDKGVYLVKTTDQWFNALEKLIVSKDHREDMGGRLYQEVLDNHTIQKNVKKYEDYFTQLTIDKNKAR